jgi:hypothetical protein
MRLREGHDPDQGRGEAASGRIAPCIIAPSATGATPEEAEAGEVLDLIERLSWSHVRRVCIAADGGSGRVAGTVLP